MEIAFAGRPFSEVARNNPRRNIWIREALQFESVGCTRCLGELCCQRRGYGVLEYC